MTEFEKKAIEALADIPNKRVDSFTSTLIWNLYKTLMDTPEHVYPTGHALIICDLVLIHLDDDLLRKQAQARHKQLKNQQASE